MVNKLTGLGGQPESFLSKILTSWLTQGGSNTTLGTAQRDIMCVSLETNLSETSSMSQGRAWHRSCPLELGNAGGHRGVGDGSGAEETKGPWASRGPVRRREGPHH